MNIKKYIAIIVAFIMMVSISPVSAMTTQVFDNGMKKGIGYFNEGKYKEAVKEFQWFCDNYWGSLNPEQQKYALDYLDGAKSMAQIMPDINIYYDNSNISQNERDIIMSAYLDVLNSLKGDGEWDARYVVYDIDKNGICELIIESGVASESILYFYTFNDGVVNFLGEKIGSHAYLASIPNENGVLRISAHSDFQHVSVIYISENNICEKEVMAKRFTVADYEVHNWEYYQPYEFYEGSVSLEFLESNDLSGFGDFNYIESGSVSTASYETGMKKGIEYYNDGMYYEAIDQIQWLCDVNWYNMTEEQQNEALWYLKNAKSKLADYSFKSGKDYYNCGMYYEARTEFETAINLYKQLNDSQWTTVNDWLSKVNSKINHWEKGPHDWMSATCASPKKCYTCGKESGSPTYEHYYNKNTGKCKICGNQLLYSGKGINIYFLGLSYSYNGIAIKFKIENNSNKMERIQVRNESVNDYMMSLIMSQDVMPGKTAITSADIWNQGMSIEDIYNIEFKFILCESDYLTPTISLNF